MQPQLPSGLAGLPLVIGPARLRGMLDPARTAVVIVDVQADFAAPQGAMAAAGCNLSSVAPAIERMELVIKAARQARVPCIWLRVNTREDTDSGACRRLYERRGLPLSALAVCREDTPGAAYHRLTPDSGELEIRKPLYSGFHGTDLDTELKTRGIGALILMGLTTECCVDSTARDAFHRDYDVFIVADACAAYSERAHRAALDALAGSFALLTTSDVLVAALKL